MDLRRLVDRIADALGPEADPARVEAVAAAVLDDVAPARTGEAARFDLHALTLGISLRDCSSTLPQTVRARVYDKIRRVAAHHVAVAEAAAADHGAQLARTRVAVTPVALVAGSLSRDELIGLAQTMDTAAEDVGVDELTGFSALVEHGMTRGDRALIDALPHALASTERLCASVNCGSTAAGLNADAVLHMAGVIKETARLTAERQAAGCARLTTWCNADGANAFHGPGGAEAAISVALSGPGVLLRAVREAGPDADLGRLAEAVTTTAFTATRAGQRIGRVCAERLTQRAGVPVALGGVRLSLAPAAGGSAGDVLAAMGLDDAGAPGATAARALLANAVRQGGLCLEGGFDLTALPGETPAETLAGLLLDAFTLGLAAHQPTACRLVPVPGKRAGDYAEWGGLLGRAAIVPVSTLSSEVFARRGGQIPGRTGG